MWKCIIFLGGVVVVVVDVVSSQLVVMFLLALSFPFSWHFTLKKHAYVNRKCVAIYSVLVALSHLYHKPELALCWAHGVPKPNHTNTQTHTHAQTTHSPKGTALHFRGTRALSFVLCNGNYVTR